MAGRREKYPDTDTFTYYNANPRNRLGGDCAVRAICTAMNISWEQAVRDMTEVGIEIGYVLDDKKTIEEYLKRKGWTKHKQMKHDDGTKYRGEEFCNEVLETDRPVIANIGSNHIVCIKNWRVHDIWNCTHKTVGNYWTR